MKSKKHEPSSLDTKLPRKKKRNRVSLFVKKKTENIDVLLHMRIPILGSVGVKARVEMFHDLLDLQIKTSSGQHFSSSIYANSDPEAGVEAGVSGSVRQSTSIESSHGTGMMLGLCRLLITLDEEKQYKTDSMDVRNTIRFHLLQYLLGLDERWTLTQTAAACRLVLEAVQSASVLVGGHSGVGAGVSGIAPSVVAYGSFAECSANPFSWCGPKSSILSEASFNILTRGVPKDLFGAVCSVRFSVATGGGSIIALLHAAEAKFYQACILVIKDSIGHVFGGFVSQQLRKGREYSGNGECFVFSVYPATKIYSWQKRNDYCFYLTDHNVGMGGGGKGFSFLLDEDLSLGSSTCSDTFQNPTLSFTEQFQCAEFELIVFE